MINFPGYKTNFEGESLFIKYYRMKKQQHFIKYKSVEVATKLLEAGENPNLKNSQGRNGLMACSGRGWYYCMEKILKYITDINDRDNNGYTALMHACSSIDNIYSVRKLLETGADPNIVSNNGDTALSISMDSGEVEYVKLIKKYIGRQNEIPINNVQSDNIELLI